MLSFFYEKKRKNNLLALLNGNKSQIHRSRK